MPVISVQRMDWLDLEKSSTYGLGYQFGSFGYRGQYRESRTELQCWKYCFRVCMPEGKKLQCKEKRKIHTTKNTYFQKYVAVSTQMTGGRKTTSTSWTTIAVRLCFLFGLSQVSSWRSVMPHTQILADWSNQHCKEWVYRYTCILKHVTLNTCQWMSMGNC